MSLPDMEEEDDEKLNQLKAKFQVAIDLNQSLQSDEEVAKPGRKSTDQMFKSKAD